MWNTFVSNSDTALRHLQAGFSDAVTAHPVLVASTGAIGMGLVVTVWAQTRMRQLGMLQARPVDSGVPTWLRR